MADNNPQLIVATSPYDKRPVDTPAIMRHVLYALAPATLAAIYYFGLSALLLVSVCAFTCALTEWLLTGRGHWRDSTVKDSSAIVTGVLLGLTLPPGLPLWMAAVGSVFAIAFGKLLFGGLGQNVFNPSLTGRAFLQAAFPVPLTTWAPYSNLDGFFSFRGDTLALPFLRPEVDALTTATPLALIKFDFVSTDFSALLYGATSGSTGETSAVLILLGGAYLTWRRFLNMAQPMDAATAPIPKANNSQPSPTESVWSSSRVKMGRMVVWNVHPEDSITNANANVPQSTCSLLTYLSPSMMSRNTELCALFSLLGSLAEEDLI